MPDPCLFCVPGYVPGRMLMRSEDNPVTAATASSSMSRTEALVPPSTLEIVRARYAPKKGAS